MHQCACKKRLSIIAVAAVLLLSCLPVRAEAYTLDEALKLVGTSETPGDSGLIGLEGDFSQYDLLRGGEFELADGKFIILRREAPLKQFNVSDTLFPEDYEGIDLGSPKVSLCAGLMAALPEQILAKTSEEAANVIMAETLYLHTGSIITTMGGEPSLPTEEALEAVLAGGSGEEVEIPQNEAEVTYQYKPMFTGLSLISLYNRETLGSTSVDLAQYDYAELRENPAADDHWINMAALADVAAAATSGQSELLGDALDMLEMIGFLSPQELEDLNRRASEGDVDGMAGLCMERFWTMAEELKVLDPKAAEHFDKAILKHSLPGMQFIVSLRQYAGVHMDDNLIIETKSYIGEVDMGALDRMLSDALKTLGLIGQ